MQESFRVKSLFIEKKPVISLIKKVTVQNSSERVFNSNLKFHSQLVESGKIQETCPLFYFIYNGWAYVFEGSEDEICEKIRELKPKKVGQTPESVLIKMVSSRFIEIQDAIINANKNLDESNKYLLELKKEGRDFGAQRRVEEAKIAGLEFNDVENGFARFKHGRIDGWVRTSVIDELGSIFNKPEMNEEIVKKAWGVFLTHKVMTL
jgi:uncharacterized protein YlzI (FlbEa/FlbD family)